MQSSQGLNSTLVIPLSISEGYRGSCVYSSVFTPYDKSCSHAGKHYWAEFAAIGLTILFPRERITFVPVDKYDPYNYTNMYVNDTTNEIGYVSNVPGTVTTPVYLFYRSQAAALYKNMRFYGPTHQSEAALIYRSDMLPYISTIKWRQLRVLGYISIAIGVCYVVYLTPFFENDFIVSMTGKLLDSRRLKCHIKLITQLMIVIQLQILDGYISMFFVRLVSSSIAISGRRDLLPLYLNGDVDILAYNPSFNTLAMGTDPLSIKFKKAFETRATKRFDYDDFAKVIFDRSVNNVVLGETTNGDFLTHNKCGITIAKMYDMPPFLLGGYAKTSSKEFPRLGRNKIEIIHQETRLFNGRFRRELKCPKPPEAPAYLSLPQIKTIFDTFTVFWILSVIVFFCERVTAFIYIKLSQRHYNSWI